MVVVEKKRVAGLVPQWPLESEIGAFLTDRMARGLSERTIQFYSSELETWQNWTLTQGTTELADITPDLLRRWLLVLGKRRNAGGVHANYRSLKAFLRWTWDENEIDGLNPIRRVRAPKVAEELLEPLVLTDFKAMLATCGRDSFTGRRDRALLLALLDTGCRASEFLSLDLGDVDSATGAAMVRHGKGGKRRMTFLGTRSRRALRRYLRHRVDTSEEEPLWVTMQDERLKYAGLRSIVRRRAARAGVSVPSLHSFRRAFAISSLRNGVDVYSLQRLMGHADLTMLRRYLKQTETDLQEAHRKTGPVDHM